MGSAIDGFFDHPSRTRSAGRWMPTASRRLYAECDAAFNLCGSQEIRERHQSIRCRAYIETDPVMNQVAVASGNQELIKHLDGYDFLFTYGENLGADDCLAPVTRYDWKKTRPPGAWDWWETSETSAARCASDKRRQLEAFRKGYRMAGADMALEQASQLSPLH